MAETIDKDAKKEEFVEIMKQRIIEIKKKAAEGYTEDEINKKIIATFDGMLNVRT